MASYHALIITDHLPSELLSLALMSACATFIAYINVSSVVLDADLAIFLVLEGRC